MSFSGEQKAFCVLDFHSNQCLAETKRHFRTKFKIPPPTDKTLKKWYSRFSKTGCLCEQKRSGRPKTNEDSVEMIRSTFLNSPQKSIRRGSLEVAMCPTTVWRVLRKRLLFKPFRLQMLQALIPTDLPKRESFCSDMLQKMQNENFSKNLIFSDESTFHLTGKVNTHNVRIWGTENPNAIIEIQRDSAKINVFCAISRQKVYGPYFFDGLTINSISYLNLLKNFIFPLMENESDEFIFQQDGAPPHYHTSVREFLNQRAPNRWIGRCSSNDDVLLTWPPRSPDLTPCDFFLWGFIKDKVYVPPLPIDIITLKTRITSAIQSIQPENLVKVWEEMEYRFDVCRITKGAHIEHL